MAKIPGTPASHWMESSGRTSYPALSGDTQADVAVVGGGIAGLCTAWELTRAGHSVILLEADRIAAGVTGHTTAKLTAQHTLIYAHLRSAFGPETARLYAASQMDAIEHAADTAAALGIECEFERRAAYTYTISEEEKQVEEIQQETEAAREAGLPASFVTDTGLPFPVSGAIRVEDQAQFHPRRYLLALAEDLVRRGGRICERTRITGLSEGRPCQVTAEDGSVVTARDIVVATHYPVFDRAMLFSRLIPRRELVVAGAIDAALAPDGMYITPQENTRSVRTAPYRDGKRLLIITGEKAAPGEPGVTARFQRLAAWAREHFPLEDITHHWATQDNFTTDRVPYVGPFHPGADHVQVATGFGGWGMTGGIMAGRLITTLVQGGKSPWAEIYDPRRLHPLAEAGPFLKANLANARHFVADRLWPSHTRAADAPDSADTLQPGTGAVVRLHGDRCAAYRDDSGKLHTVSAVCSHLGCIVAFNDAEHTWDCPCHGSRFGVDGEVVQGPAVKPLEPLATGDAPQEGKGR